MQLKNRTTGLKPLSWPWQQPAPETQASDSRYTHIVVPIRLMPDDRPALLLGLQLAALDKAKLTVLYVTPPLPRDFSEDGLDALSLLHHAVGRINGRKPSQDQEDSAERTRLQVTEFLERVIPEHLRQQVNICVECRAEAIGKNVAGLVNEQAADLLVISTGVSRWWLPVLPARVRRLLRLSRAQVILVRPDEQVLKPDRQNCVGT